MKSKSFPPHSLPSLAALFLLPAFISAAEPPGIPDGWSARYVYANGVRLHYYRAVPAPDKPAIVMVHGITDNGLCWAPLGGELQDEYDIYMLDARGHGLSDPFTTTDSGDTLILDVVAAVEALGIRKPILMGHSMGAATVMRVGAEHPELAQAIILLDPFLARPAGEGRPRGPASAEPRAPARESAPEERPSEPSPDGPGDANPPGNRLSIGMAGDPERLVAQNNHDFEDLVATARRQFPRWSDASVIYWALSKKQYHGAYSEAAWQVMSGAMRTGDALGSIPVPVLVLKADTSAEGRQSNEQAVQGMERVKLVHIDGAGHSLHHDDLERTLEEVATFLTTLAPDAVR